MRKVGYIKWASDLARIPEEHGVSNVYGELGSTLLTQQSHPRFCAAFIGTLVKGLGADHVYGELILFGMAHLNGRSRL